MIQNDAKRSWTRVASQFRFWVALLFLQLSNAAYGSEFETWLARFSNNSQLVSTFRVPSGEFIVREIKDVDAASPHAGLTICWAELPASKLALSVKVVSQFGPSHTIFSASLPEDALAAINGGFYGYDKTGKNIPLGLVIENLRTQNPVIKWNTGAVFYQEKDGRILLTPIRDFHLDLSIVSAIQSKPLLVEHGTVAIRSDDNARFNRTAVALTKRGTILFAGAFESFGRALTLSEFARFLVELKRLAEIEVDTALAMDGGPGAQMFFPTLSRHYGDPGNNYIPNLIYVRRSSGGK